MSERKRKMAKKTVGGPAPPLTKGSSLRTILSAEDKEGIAAIPGITEYPAIYGEMESMWEHSEVTVGHPALDYERLKKGGEGLYEPDLVFKHKETNPWNMDNDLSTKERFDQGKKLYDAAKTEVGCLGTALAREYDLRMAAEEESRKLRAENTKLKKSTPTKKIEKVLRACKIVVENTVGRDVGPSAMYQMVRHSLQEVGKPLDDKDRAFLLKYVLGGDEDEEEAEEKDFLMDFPQFVEGANLEELGPADMDCDSVVVKAMENWAPYVSDLPRVVALNQAAQHFVRVTDALVPQTMEQADFQVLCFGLLQHQILRRPGMFNGLNERRFEKDASADAKGGGGDDEGKDSKPKPPRRSSRSAGKVAVPGDVVAQIV